MKITYEGKTKRLLKAEGYAVLKFEDAITGDAAGNPDPGGNFVIGNLRGKGIASARVTAYFFDLINKAGIPNHFRKLCSGDEIEVVLAVQIPLEVIYRTRAFGSFLARYRGHVEPLAPLDLVEFNLKDDTLEDPLISPRAIQRLRIASDAEIEKMDETIRKVASVISKKFVKFCLELIDMKLEFGRKNGELLVIDEISGDTMRVYDPAQKKVLNQLELAERLGLS